MRPFKRRIAYLSLRPWVCQIAGGNMRPAPIPPAPPAPGTALYRQICVLVVGILAPDISENAALISRDQFNTGRTITFSEKVRLAAGH